jgi:hypothetical protein
MSLLVHDYNCKKCDIMWEFLIDSHLKDTDMELEETKCPICHEPTERLPSAPVWKWASGWRGY